MKKGVIVLAMCTVMGFILPSCEKEGYDISPQMELFYTESIKLPSATLDSVQSFSSKVDGFTRSYPEALEHKRYPQIKENIKSASLRITITCDTTWTGETHINF